MKNFEDGGLYCPLCKYLGLELQSRLIEDVHPSSPSSNYPWAGTYDEVITYTQGQFYTCTRYSYEAGIGT